MSESRESSHSVSRRSFLLLMAFVSAGTIVVAACASGGQSSGPRSGNRNVITAEELQQVDVSNAYQAIQRLRPMWLRSRSGGGDPAVFIDNVRAGDLNMLETLYLTNIQELRYVSPSDATTRWGTGYPTGAIEVITRRR